MEKFRLKNRAAIAILRVSSHRQDGNSSHQVQEERVMEYCAELNLDLIEIRRIVESAKRSDERVKYSEAISFALKKGIFNILFYMNDREARNLTDNESNELLVKDGKIVIHYVNDRKVLHKDSSASDFLMRDFYAVQNKNFSRVLSERVNDVMRKKAENGWFPGNRPPLGYIHQKIKDEDGREQKRGTIIVPDPNSSMVRWVQREFELRAEGQTIDQIHSKVLLEGIIPVSRSRSYSRNGIEERLKNSFYWGSFVWQGVRYKGNHKLIIPKEILSRVEESFGKRGPYGKNPERRAIFSGGWLNCGEPNCSKQIVYDPKTKISRLDGTARLFKYYRCSNSRRVHDKLVYVSEENIWLGFSEVVNSVHLSLSLAQRISDELNKSLEDSSKLERKAKEKTQLQIDVLMEKKNKLLDLVMTGALDESEYKYQVQRTRSELERLERERLDSEQPSSESILNSAHSVFELAINAKSLWNQGSTQQRLDLLKVLCSNPKLTGRSIEYDLKKRIFTVKGGRR